MPLLGILGSYLCRWQVLEDAEKLNSGLLYHVKISDKHPIYVKIRRYIAKIP